MAFQLNSLQTFVTFVESKNIFEAAKVLGISQPSVTVHLRYLEDWFDTQLFSLVGKKKVLNPQGRLLYSSCRNKVKSLTNSILDVERGLRSLDEISIKLAGRRELFSRVLPHAEFGGVLSYVSCSSKQAIELLLSNDSDFAISTTRPDSLEVVSRKIFSEKLHFIIPKKYFSSKPTLRKLSKKPFLERVPVISYNKDLPHISDWIKSCGLENLSIKSKVNIDDWNQVVSIVEAGAGYTICPESFSSKKADTYTIEIPTRVLPTIDIYLLQRVDTKKTLPWEKLFSVV